MLPETIVLDEIVPFTLAVIVGIFYLIEATPRLLKDFLGYLKKLKSATKKAGVP